MGSCCWRAAHLQQGLILELIMCIVALQRAYCGQCSERIWGLAKQGYKCINCKLLVHKRCHILVPLTCKRHMVSVCSGAQGCHSGVFRCVGRCVLSNEMWPWLWVCNTWEYLGFSFCGGQAFGCEQRESEK